MRKNLTIAMVAVLLGSIATANCMLNATKAHAATISYYSQKVVDSWSPAQVSRCGQRLYHLQGHSYTVECLGAPALFAGVHPLTSTNSSCGHQGGIDHGDVILYVNANYTEPTYPGSGYGDDLCFTGTGYIPDFTKLPICVYFATMGTTSCSGWGNWNDKVSSLRIGQYSVDFWQNIYGGGTSTLYYSNQSISYVGNAVNDSFSSAQVG